MSTSEAPAVPGGDVASRAVEPVVKYRERPVPPEVEQRLREISPISEVHSWLAIRWHPDFGRYVFYECVPNQYIDAGFRAELEGAHPDTLPDWARICSAYQWEMYRRHRVHARPCWIVQGAHGGHKVEFDSVDQELLRAQGLPPEAPKPGSLPFAPIDERVWQQLIRLSKLVRVKNDLAEFRRRYGTTEEHKRTYRNALREARKQYVAFVNQQFADGDEHFKDAYRKGELEHAPRTEDDFAEKEERQDEKYLDHGRF